MQGNVFLWVCLLLTAIWLISLFLDSKAFLAPWSSESKESIQDTLMGLDRDANGVLVPVNLGPVLRPKLEAMAAREVDKLSHMRLAQYWLGRFYGVQPFHPDSWNRALLIAFGYSLLFFLTPWFLGDEGRLGSIVLLPKEAPSWAKLFIAFVFALGLLLIWACRTERLSHQWTVWAFSIIWPLSLLVKGVSTGYSTIFNVAILTVSLVLGTYFAPVMSGIIAITLASAFAIVTAFAVSYMICAALAGALAIAWGFLAFYHYLNIYPPTQGRAKQTSWTWRLWRTGALLVIVVFILLTIGSAPFWLGTQSFVRDSVFAVTSLSFSAFFFLALIPALNALFDYVSVGITQWCLERMVTL